MPIPDFDGNGLLPPGVHACTLEELGLRFGTFQTHDRRPALFARFKELFGAMQQSQLFVAVIINGSFVSDKAVPNDIDLILALKPGHVQPSELGVADYALLSRRRLHRRFGFDVLIAEDGSALYKKYVRFYSQLREDPYATKGILRIDL